MNTIKEAADCYAEEHGFRVPYDGTNNFYDEVDIRTSKEGFIAGVVFAEKLTSVEDELPNEENGYLDKDVLIKSIDNKYSIAFYNEKYGWDSLNELIDTVTHWRPINRR